MKEEAVANHPIHIFGHIAAKNAFRIKNKIHIDSGCVHGNMLTAVSISFKPFFKSHKSREIVMAEELPVLFVQERKVSIQDLDNEEIGG